MNEVNKFSDEYFKNKLNEESYNVLRLRGTERAFTGQYNSFYENGDYFCKACEQKIFSSDVKFDSKSGWPSFFEAINGSVKIVEDFSHNMVRREVICSNCESHLGHVFENESLDNKKRFCINSVSLNFKEDEKKEGK